MKWKRSRDVTLDGRSKGIGVVIGGNLHELKSLTVDHIEV